MFESFHSPKVTSASLTTILIESSLCHFACPPPVRWPISSQCKLAVSYLLCYHVIYSRHLQITVARYLYIPIVLDDLIVYCDAFKTHTATFHGSTYPLAMRRIRAVELQYCHYRLRLTLYSLPIHVTLALTVCYGSCLLYSMVSCAKNCLEAWIFLSSGKALFAACTVRPTPNGNTQFMPYSP